MESFAPRRRAASLGPRLRHPNAWRPHMWCVGVSQGLGTVVEA